MIEKTLKRLSWEEFQERIEALAKARKIFIPHLTRNISIAFELYQEVLVEEENRLKARLSTKDGGRAPGTWLDQFERPRCPECKEPLYLRKIGMPKGQANRKGWRSCWECLGPTCLHEEYSEKRIEDWAKELKRRK